MSSIGWNMMVKWYETHRNTWKSLLFLWHQNCCLLVLSKAFPKPASSICWCCQWCRCVFCFWKNPCVSRCVAWQRYHDCTLLQRASAFIACSNLREEDFLFFFGFKHLHFFWLQWVKSTRIKVLRTAEAGNSTAVCNSIEIFGSGVSEPECFEISMKHLKYPSGKLQKNDLAFFCITAMFFDIPKAKLNTVFSQLVWLNTLRVDRKFNDVFCRWKNWRLGDSRSWLKVAGGSKVGNRLVALVF